MARILTAGDDPVALDTYGALLKNAGYEVEKATNGEAAVTLVRDAPPDLMIADLFLEDVTALDLMRQFRVMKVHVPVVILTGMGTIGSAVEAMKLGAADYLLKPCDFDEVLNAVSLAIAMRPMVNQPPHVHAAARWAEAMVALIDSPIDVRTIEYWGRAIAVSPGALRNWCAVARLSPRRSLVLARLLRATLLSAGRPWEPRHVLDVAEPRTLRRMLRLGGLESTMAPTVGQLLSAQTLISDSFALDALRTSLRGRRVELEEAPSHSLRRSSESTADFPSRVT